MKKTLLAFLLITLFVLLLLYPQEVKTGALDGLYLWYNSVVPILLPFLILSNLMISTDSLAFLFSSTKTLFPKFNQALLYPVFLGLFCGFPMGAKTTSDFLKKGILTKTQAELLLPFVSQASPMFLTGFVGVHVLKKELSFGTILFFLYIPALFVLAFRCFLSILSNAVCSAKTSLQNKNIKSLSFENSVSIQNKKNSMSQNMEHTIWNSFHIVIIIGIYMMIFTILTRLCMKLLPKHNLLTILLCFLEFSTGLNQLSSLTFLTPVVKNGLILALTSFGGLCTAAQTSSLLKDTEISMKSYLFWKSVIALLVFIAYSSSISSS